MTQTSLEREQNSRATVVIVIILVIVIVIVVVVVVHAVRSLSVSRVLFGVYYYLKTPSNRWFLLN